MLVLLWRWCGSFPHVTYGFAVGQVIGAATSLQDRHAASLELGAGQLAGSNLATVVPWTRGWWYVGITIQLLGGACCVAGDLSNVEQASQPTKAGSD